MHQTTREFLIELKSLMEKYGNGRYEVELDYGDISRYSSGGLEITIPTKEFFEDGDSYNSVDYVRFSGQTLTPRDIEEKLKEGDILV